MCFPYTSVIDIPLTAIIDVVVRWINAVEHNDKGKAFFKPLQLLDEHVLKLHHVLRVLSSQIIHIPLPPVLFLDLDDVYHVLFQIKNLLDNVGILTNKIAIPRDMTPLQLEDVIAVLEAEGITELSYKLPNGTNVSVIYVLQRILDSVVYPAFGFPEKQELSSSMAVWEVLDISAVWLERIVGENKNITPVFLREMNACVLMLEVADFLEDKCDVKFVIPLSEITENCDKLHIYGSEALEIFKKRISDSTTTVDLQEEPRPFNYRLVDGGPDQKQSNIGSKIANAIEFRLETSAHACVQRRCERDSVANEAERGNSILGRSAAIGSTIENNEYKTVDEAIEEITKQCKSLNMPQEKLKSVLFMAENVGEEFRKNMNMWRGCVKVAERWNGYPCFGTKVFATPILSPFRLPLSPSLDDDIRAYSKASKDDQDNSVRFEWIRQNLDWYEAHGVIYESGYYEERRICEDIECCGKGRMVPLPKATTPKPSQSNPGHYEEKDNITATVNNEEELQRAVQNLSLMSKLEVDRNCYCLDDFFLPSNGFQRAFGEKICAGNPLTEEDVVGFRILYPCPREGIKAEEQKKKKESEDKTKRREKQLSWCITRATTTDEVSRQTVETLMRVLNELCCCQEENCELRTSGVKYDLISRIMEHFRGMKFFVPREVKLLTREEIKAELNLLSYPTGGVLLDVQERLTRARLKLWVPSFDVDRRDHPQRNCALSEQCARMSTYVHSIMCRL